MTESRGLLRFAWFCFGFSALSAAYFWLVTLGQPLIGPFDFRETQTAISAHFLDFDLASFLRYQTPVLGYPWSIPFEFPLYQAFVALVSRGFGLDLSLSGRLISLAFTLVTLWPAMALLRMYGFGRFSQLIFAALYLGSSIYLFWGRAFMIETQALCFSLTFLCGYVCLRDRHQTMPAGRYGLVLGLTALSLVLALLTKATTALAPFLLVGADVVLRPISLAGGRRRYARRVLLPLLLSLLAGFLALKAWTQHADLLKAANLTGARLTSAALHGWNYGRFEQRFSGDLWQTVVLKRMFTIGSIALALPLLLVGLWQSRLDERRREFLVASLLLAVAPLLLFSNLHIVHSYYQVANQIYLLLAIAAAATILLEHVPARRWLQILALAALVLFLLSDRLYFDRRYRAQADVRSNEKTELAAMIQQATAADAALIIIGDDWNSAIPFYSRRRALMLTDWHQPGIRSRAAILSNPGPEVRPYPIGAIVSDRDLDPRALASACPGATTIRARADGLFRAYLCRPA